jgi:hypothetical protein
MFWSIREGFKIFSRNIAVKLNGFKQYSGSDEDICKAIIDSCYDNKKQYFRASSGNYTVFYARDLGWCIESLMNLGYDTEIHNTLRYALKIYYKNQGITVAINDLGKTFNFPNIYSPDSVAYFFRALRIAKEKDLIYQYKEFLNREVKVFESKVIDLDGMLKNKHFSGMRDHVKSYGLCYDMIMACMLCDEIELLNKMCKETVINNPLKKYALKSKLNKYYWNGNYFIDGLTDEYCSGHANTYPYFVNVVTDIGKLKSSIRSIKENGLDKPFPLKYGYSKNTKFIWQEMLAPDWEKDTSWVMLGLAYIQIVSKVDKTKAREYLNQYKKLILKNRAFIELYSGDKPYTSLFFCADDSMLWASMYLDLKKKLKVK